MADVETEGEGPNRILLDTFTITVSPTPGGFSLVEGSKVKDIAEGLVKDSFEAYNWGPSTVYQYMGFTNLESVLSFDNDESYSIIRIKGGIVSFDGSSLVVPTQTEIQSMIQEELDPSGGRGAGLTAALQAIPEFSYVQETIYDTLEGPAPYTVVMPTSTSPPTEPPTRMPTQKPTPPPIPTPTLVPTRRPTEPPTFNPTLDPTKTPTERPSATSTEAPTAPPVAPQTEAPSPVPTSAPPTEAPTATPVATLEPTAAFSSAASNESTPSPSSMPIATSEPTALPSSAASDESIPSTSAIPVATLEPTAVPSSTGPEAVPTTAPSITSTPPTTATPVASEPVVMDTPEPTDISLWGYAPSQMPSISSGQGMPSVTQIDHIGPTAAPSPGLAQAQSQAIGTDGSSPPVLPVIAGIAVGLLLLGTLAFFLVYKRRREKSEWQKNVTHLSSIQEDDDLEQPIKSKDLVTSESGSSRFGKMLLSTAATVHCGVRAVTNRSEATPSQSSSDDDFSGFDEGDFDGCGISVEPIILPIGADDNVEAIEVQEGERDLESGVAALVVTSQVVADEPKLAKEPPSTDTDADDEGILFIERIAADFYGESCVDYATLMRPLEPNNDEIESAAALPSMAALNNVVEPESDFDANASSLETTAQVDSETEVNSSPDSCRSSNSTHANHDEVDKDWHFDSRVDDLHIERQAYAAERDCDLMLFADSSVADSDVFEDIDLGMQTYAQQEKFESAVEMNGDPANQDDFDAGDSVSDVFDDLPDANDSVSDVFDSLEVYTNSSDIFDDVEAISGAIGNVGAENMNTSQEEDLSTIAKIDSFNDDMDAVVVMKADAARPTTKAWEDFNNEPCIQPPPGESTFRAESPEFATLSTIRSNRWSDVSSEHSLCLSMSDDNDDDHQEFTLDESWDFNDNANDDSSDVVDDLFRAASTLPSNDTRPLLGNSGVGSFKKQTSSDESVNDNALTDNGDGDVSDVSLGDPFQTSATTPVNDDEPLLGQVHETYKLEKVATCGGEKRRRSKSAPPRTDGNSGTGSIKEQTASDETAFSNAPTDEVDDHSDVSLGDPFQTSTTTPMNEMDEAAVSEGDVVVSKSEERSEEKGTGSESTCRAVSEVEGDEENDDQKWVPVSHINDEDSFVQSYATEKSDAINSLESTEKGEVSKLSAEKIIELFIRTSLSANEDNSQSETPLLTESSAATSLVDETAHEEIPEFQSKPPKREKLGNSNETFDREILLAKEKVERMNARLADNNA